MAALKHGSRKFYEIPSENLQYVRHDREVKNHKKIEELFKYIENSCIGKDLTFTGPYGLRKVIYCDYTASGRSLSFIEDYIQEQVLPHYGNTHTTTTVTSLQTTLYRHEARDIIRNAVNASEHDSVIFVGNGVTGGVHKLIHALDLKKPPVVFVGPFEHHSNLLPWKEIRAKVVWIKQDLTGQVDLSDLEMKLKLHSPKGDTQLIGCFSAASNVTGILTDTNAVTACLHQYDALAFWDYATAGPYVKINMNPFVTSEQGLVHKDAIFISTHKFVGGVQTPGILVAKKKLFENPVPSGCGGGSVFFVTENSHRYLKEIEMREESGTPAIVGDVRAGLVFQLKQDIGASSIMAKEENLCRRALASWENIEDLIILGNTAVSRLAIFSFVIRHPISGVLLHHNYVCALLNDLFGIQARGGCACAGPYAQNLLGINEKLAKEIEALILEDSRLDRIHLRRYNEYSEREILRPGFVRLNLPYFMSDDAVHFVLEAVKMVAEHGWKLLPRVFRDRKWLGSISYAQGHMTYPSSPLNAEVPSSFMQCLREAEELFQRASIETSIHSVGDQRLLLGEEGEKLRWFLFPSEAALLLRGKEPAYFPLKSPFTPIKWKDVMPLTQGTNLTGPPCVEHFERSSTNSTPSVLSNGKTTTSTHIVGKSVIEKEMRGRIFVADGKDCDKGHLITSQRTGENQDPNKALEEVLSYVNEEYHALKIESQNAEDGWSDKGRGIDRIPNGYCSAEMGDCSVSQVDGQVFTNGTNDLLNDHEGDSKFVVEQTISKASSEERRKESKEDYEGVIDVKVAYEQNNEKKCKRKEMSRTPQFHHPPKSIFKPTTQAIEEYEMICDGDRVLVCLSGGKDSLSLLHTLHQFQFYSKSKGITFELGAVTVDPQSSGYDPRPLIPYLNALGVPYFFEEQGIIEQAAKLTVCESICSFCSRMKRGRLYACARRESYNVLAMGQHLDDLAESFLMSAFHNGLLRTMKANYTVMEGDLRVIRPFVYVREKDLRSFAEKVKLPVIAENCPACFEAPKERHRTKQLLAAQEILFPDLYNSLLTAMKPLMARDRVGLESSKMKKGNYEDFL
ncbi:uncharacterized protein LOC141879105 isoform X3 [Acropora palmata]|uniref:uncharacterized protein LOC141879105 isoform X3 n=1 Tax=Acropora palmata TaxID=6131 RepID=UPI003DA0E400